MSILIIVMGMLGFGLMVLLAYLRAEEESEENRMMKYYIISMEHMHSLIETRIEAMRAYRHDLAKHIRTLSTMVEKEKGETLAEIRQYSEELKKEYQKLDKSKICEDEIVNAIISIKIQQCETKEIPFEAEIEDTVYSGIQGTDMTAILYNLLDNAVEANEKIKDVTQRGIWLNMGCKDHEVWIELRNKTVRSDLSGNFMFDTTKNRKLAHGFGTKIVQKYAEKYKGSREITVDKEENLITIRLNLKIDDKESDQNLYGRL